MSDPLSRRAFLRETSGGLLATPWILEKRPSSERRAPPDPGPQDESGSAVRSSREPGPLRSELLEQAWDAQWIAHPDTPAEAFGVDHFRRTIELTTNPERFTVHVSADNRYRLFVNGTIASEGPARGDLPHWRFETVDLAELLTPGTNVISALVWNFGVHRPAAQITRRTGFLLQGDGKTAKMLDTGTRNGNGTGSEPASDTADSRSGWIVHRNEGYDPQPVTSEEVGEVYYVAGACERIDGSRYPWGWTREEIDEETWAAAEAIEPGMPRWGPDAVYEGWKLVPRRIPAMAHHTVRPQRVRRSDGMESNQAEALVREAGSITIPAQSSVRLLLDQSHLVTAYPNLTVSGGSGARMELRYAEALVDENGRKGHRDRIEGKRLRGYHDTILPDGGTRRHYQTAWFRTYRYVELRIETGAEPLELHELYGRHRGYPFEEQASFTCDDPSLEEIWEVGWRTARLCAHETYYDCPYYEQLQYVGDTRIQALISLCVGGEDRLMRRAITDFAHSRIPEGPTSSRYPASSRMMIPPYALLWISMVHDFWRYRRDDQFVADQLHAAEGILEWYAQFVGEDGLLGRVPWWNFVDWAWDSGLPERGENGRSALTNLQFLYVLQHAVELFEAFDRPASASRCGRLADRLAEGLRATCWDAGRGLMANSPDRNRYSQHGSLLAVLTDLVEPENQQRVMTEVLENEELTACTYYFRFYLHRALQEAGLADRYVDQLGPWRSQIEKGLTTFAEEPDPTRSDCHAWSAHPLYDFLTTICGIRPAAPGFERVRIEPALGPLEEVSGVMPHPDGKIEVDLRHQDDTLSGTVTLPQPLTGRFRWNDREEVLEPGTNPL